MVQRGKTYHANFRAHGRRVRKRLSTDFKAACELLNDLRARADRGDFGIVDNNYPWDELKAESNFVKHRVEFASIVDFEMATAVVEEDDG